MKGCRRVRGIRMWRDEEGQCGNEGLRLGKYDTMGKLTVLHEVETMSR
jgi:hypothetical protein